MGLFKTVKTNARRALSGNWGRAVGILFITAIPMVLINLLEFGIRAATGVSAYESGAGNALASVRTASLFIFSLISLLIFIIMTPLRQGRARWYYHRTNGEEEGVSTLFHYFETAGDYFRALGLQVQVAVRMLFWCLLLSLPALAAAGFHGFYLGRSGAGIGGRAAVFGMALMMLWLVIAGILGAVIALRYFLAPYLLAEHPEWRARQAIRQGVRLTRGHKGSLFLFGLSFIGWLSPLVIGGLLAMAAPFSHSYYLMRMGGAILLLMTVQAGLLFFVSPYMNSSYAMYARYLIQLGEGNADAAGEDAGEYEDSTREYDCGPETDRYPDAARREESPPPREN